MISLRTTSEWFASHAPPEPRLDCAMAQLLQGRLGYFTDDALPSLEQLLTWRFVDAEVLVRCLERHPEVLANATPQARVGFRERIQRARLEGDGAALGERILALVALLRPSKAALELVSADLCPRLPPRFWMELGRSEPGLLVEHAAECVAEAHDPLAVAMTDGGTLSALGSWAQRGGALPLLSAEHRGELLRQLRKNGIAGWTPELVAILASGLSLDRDCLVWLAAQGIAPLLSLHDRHRCYLWLLATSLCAPGLDPEIAACLLDRSYLLDAPVHRDLPRLELDVTVDAVEAYLPRASPQGRLWAIVAWAQCKPESKGPAPMQRPEFRVAATEGFALRDGQGPRFLDYLVTTPRGSAFHAEYALSQHRVPKGKRSGAATEAARRTILEDHRFPALPPDLIIELFVSLSSRTLEAPMSEFREWVERATANIDAGGQQARLLALECRVRAHPDCSKLRWMSRTITTIALELCIDRGLIGWLHIWFENHGIFKAKEFERWWTSAVLNFSPEALLDESLWILQSILEGRTDRNDLLGTIPVAWDPTLERIRARLT